LQHGGEQRRLAGEALVERALGYARAPGDRLDAGDAVALGQEQRAGGVEDAVGDQRRPGERRASAARRDRDLGRRGRGVSRVQRGAP